MRSLQDELFGNDDATASTDIEMAHAGSAPQPSPYAAFFAEVGAVKANIERIR